MVVRYEPPASRYARRVPLLLRKKGDASAPFVWTKGARVKRAGYARGDTGLGRCLARCYSVIAHHPLPVHTPRTRYACARPFRWAKGAVTKKTEQTKRKGVGLDA